MGLYANQPVRGSAAAKQRATALCKRAAQHGLVAELGTMRGPMCAHAIAMRTDLEWIMVDNWLPMMEQPQRYKNTRDDNAFKDPARCQADREGAYSVASTGHVSILSMSTTEAAALLQPESLDLVFIDADHSYEGVKEDIVNWYPLVKKGGWVGGHDYKNIDPRFGGVDRAVDEFFDEVEEDLNYTWWVRK